MQKLQQVQQGGPSTLLNMPSLAGGNHKQFSAQHQNPLLPQVIFHYLADFYGMLCLVSVRDRVPEGIKVYKRKKFSGSMGKE